jgi:hypothetical protein
MASTGKSAATALAPLMRCTSLAREMGAITGLANGYAVKCQLDRRFVFRPSPPRPA